MPLTPGATGPAAGFAASFACAIQTGESLLDLMFVGLQAHCITSGRGLSGAEQLIEILASVLPCRDKPFKALFPLVMQRASLLSSCICILLSWDQERKEFVKKLREGGLPLLVLVITEESSSEPLDAGPMKDDPENLHRLRVGRIQEDLAAL